MIKYKLLLAIFSTSMIVGINQVKAAFAAEPHSDEHLFKYGENPAFDATVLLKGYGGSCSASRIKLGEDDPIDFYATAAHCFPKFSPLDEQLFIARRKIFEEINQLAIAIPIDQINIKEIVEKHFSPFSDSELESVLDKSKIEYASKIEERLKKTSIGELLSKFTSNARVIQQKDIDYISKYPESDFAIFTTNELSNKPKYSLYLGSLNDLISKSVTSVGFGETQLNKTEEPCTRRQAFDSIIESVQYKELDSAVFKPDLNRTLKDTPIGIVTSGDSGGALLIKDNAEYKFIGVVKSTFGFISPDIYESIPESLKSNSHNQDCIQKIKTLSWQSLMELKDPCYGQVSTWTSIDLPFLNRVKENLLSRKGVYAYPSEIKDGYPSITFSLANELKNEVNNGYSEKQKNFIGYASKHSQLNILIDEETFLALPLQLVHSHFVYQQGDKHYPIEVTVEETPDEKNFLVKAVVLNEENDRGPVHDLINTLSRAARSLIDYLSTDDNESHDAIASLSRPIYYFYPLDSDLPLKVSLNKCLSKNNLWIPEENSRGMELLGYSTGSFEAIIKLAGQEMKRLTVSDVFLLEEFECQYDGKSYHIELSVTNTGEKIDIVLFHKRIVAPPKQAANTPDVLQTTHAELSHVPVYFVRSCGTVSSSHVDLQLVEDVESQNSQYAKEGTKLKLTVADEELAYWPINKEGTYRTIYRSEDAILYTIEVTVQKFDFPKTHYKVDLSIEKLDKN